MLWKICLMRRYCLTSVLGPDGSKIIESSFRCLIEVIIMFSNSQISSWPTDKSFLSEKNSLTVAEMTFLCALRDYI